MPSITVQPHLAIERIAALGSVVEPPRMIRIEDF